MLRRLVAASIPLLFATAVWGADPTPMTPPEVQGGSHSVSPVPVEASGTVIQLGGPAPTFSYLAADGQWYRFQDLFNAHGVLLVFEPSDQDLADMERLRGAFNEMGVRPVPVLSGSTHSTARAARRAGYTGTVVSDPMQAIAGLYHSLSPSSRNPATAYFVIDAKRKLRAVYYGPMPPVELLLASAARGLGLPLPASMFTTTNDR